MTRTKDTGRDRAPRRQGRSLAATALTCALLAFVSAARAAPPQRRVPETVEARRSAYRCSLLTKEPAIAACREALALGLTAEHAATVHSLLALHLAGLNRWEEVVASYRELVRLRPDDALARWRLGDALLYGLDQPREALAPLRDAVRLAPALAGAHLSLGVALDQLKDGSAAAAFEEALRLDPRCLEARPGARAVFESAGRSEP